MGPLRPAVCAEIMCCPPSQATEEPACRPMGFTTPQDELQATQHLIQGEFGQHITHILVLRWENLALSLARANMPVKDLVTSLAGRIDATFLAEAVKCYCETLHQGATTASVNSWRCSHPRVELCLLVTQNGIVHGPEPQVPRLPWPWLVRPRTLRMANAQQAPLCDSGEGQETLLGRGGVVIAKKIQSSHNSAWWFFGIFRTKKSIAPCV